MPLVECPECSKEVSENAYECPNCGVTLKKLQRSIFGKVVKWLFIIFNILMVLWIVFGINAGADEAAKAASEAEKAGTQIGTGIGVAFLVVLWALGDIILGTLVFFTRAKKK